MTLVKRGVVIGEARAALIDAQQRVMPQSKPGRISAWAGRMRWKPGVRRLKPLFCIASSPVASS